MRAYELGKDTFHFRPINENDLIRITRILSKQEGYTISDNSNEVSTEAQYNEMLSFVRDPKKYGFILTLQNSSKIHAIILFQLRHYYNDVFESHSIIQKLDKSIFPLSGEFAEVFDLWVLKSSRRKGLATFLKVEMEAVVKEYGIDMIYTHTEKSNAHIIELNEKLGYKIIREGSIWDDVVRASMVKNLGLT